MSLLIRLLIDEVVLKWYRLTNWSIPFKRVGLYSLCTPSARKYQVEGDEYRRDAEQRKDLHTQLDIACFLVYSSLTTAASEPVL